MGLKATDPKQYDLPTLDWRVGGAEDRPSRAYFREELGRVVSPDTIKGKRVLDIGSGVGQLFNWLRERGASEVFGIDPSSRNTQTSKERYPWATVMESTLHDFASTDKKFDVAIAILVFEHIQDLNEAFADVHRLLNPGGEFYLIVADKDFNLQADKTKRGARFVSLEILNDFGDGIVEVKTTRDEGENGYNIIYDIFRPAEHVRQAAKAAGFELFIEKEVLGPYTAPPEKRVDLMDRLYGFRKQ